MTMINGLSFDYQHLSNLQDQRSIEDPSISQIVGETSLPPRSVWRRYIESSVGRQSKVRCYAQVLGGILENHPISATP